MAEEKLLVPLEEYLKAGIHIGTKFKTEDMKPFIYKVRPDGLYVLNVEDINKRLDIAASFIAQYNPEDILIICRRESGWSIVNLVSKITGIKKLIGRYPPGILTNVRLKNFIEPKLIIIVDPWPDKNAVRDGFRMGIPTIALSDTNNDSREVDLMIPCNNKGKKSLALVFYILAREYMKRKKIINEDSEFKYTIEDFSKD
ncbi:MAG: 30S ribosomal protein S2 [Nanoarchaeota archaeon]|nr:30S ribosomal protein S2 [Nanoarchaeota archaeon]MBU0962837.1 30S ribosomal protein S2 [Nanoarchaeota archaeon]